MTTPDPESPQHTDDETHALAQVFALARHRGRKHRESRVRLHAELTQAATRLEQRAATLAATVATTGPRTHAHLRAAGESAGVQEAKEIVARALKIMAEADE